MHSHALTETLALQATSGFKGVHDCSKQHKGWRATVTVSSVNVVVGYFTTKLKAARARRDYIDENSLKKPEQGEEGIQSDSLPSGADSDSEEEEALPGDVDLACLDDGSYVGVKILRNGAKATCEINGVVHPVGTHFASALEAAFLENPCHPHSLHHPLSPSGSAGKKGLSAGDR